MLNITVANQPYFYPVHPKIMIDGGVLHVASFDMQFRRLGHAQCKNLIDRLENQDSALTHDELVRQVVTGWRDVVEFDGQERMEVPFTPDTLNALLDIPHMSLAIVLAWIGSVSGKEAEKN